MTTPATPSNPPTFDIGGELTVNRLGFGAMRITGKGIWGEPPDRDAAKQLLQRVLELGVNLIDTADAYGPAVSERLIAEALSPYPEGLVIATKGGLLRGGPGNWSTDGRPEHLKEAVAASLRRLRLERIDLYQLHAVDDDVPLEESVGALADMQRAGDIRFVGLSNVTVEEIERARAVVDVVTVQNRYNLSDRRHEPVLAYCALHRIGFIPWYPLATGRLAEGDGVLGEMAIERGVTTGQIALAWLLHRSPVVLPIPGTSSIEHLEENCAAAEIALTGDEIAALDALV